MSVAGYVKDNNLSQSLQFERNNSPLSHKRLSVGFLLKKKTTVIVSLHIKDSP